MFNLDSIRNKGFLCSTLSLVDSRSGTVYCEVVMPFAVVFVLDGAIGRLAGATTIVGVDSLGRS